MGVVLIDVVCIRLLADRLGIVPRSEVHLKAPLDHPEKIICIGMNYADHCTEQNLPIPEEPVIFSKFPNTITDPEEPIYLENTEELDFEVELGVVILKPGRRIEASPTVDCNVTLKSDVIKTLIKQLMTVPVSIRHIWLYWSCSFIRLVISSFTFAIQWFPFWVSPLVSDHPSSWTRIASHGSCCAEKSLGPSIESDFTMFVTPRFPDNASECERSEALSWNWEQQAWESLARDYLWPPLHCDQWQPTLSCNNRELHHHVCHFAFTVEIAHDCTLWGWPHVFSQTHFSEEKKEECD